MIIREANLNDIDNGLLNVFVGGYRFHQDGRPDVFSNLSDESNSAILEQIILF